jgi:hypothetical protein
MRTIDKLQVDPRRYFITFFCESLADGRKKRRKSNQISVNKQLNYSRLYGQQKEKRCQSIFRPRHLGMYKSRTVSPIFDGWNGMAAGAICRRGPYVLIRFSFTQLPPPPPPSGPWKLRVHDDEYTLSRKIQKGGVPKKGCAKEHSV